MGNLSAKRILVGKPLSNHEESNHRLSKRIALAVFSSDALSSSAYATDEILLALAFAGSAAFRFAPAIGLAVTAVLAIVVISYRQTVRAYPSGGGAYIVAHDNLGRYPGLIAASALLVDYVLTVAVSVAAGLAAVTAAFPGVGAHRVALAVVIVALITSLNLRGLKESGTIFAIPTYGFLLLMTLMIVGGAYKLLTGQLQPYPAVAFKAEHAVSLFLILRAFASGCTAMTGVEAISNGVPAFRKPESKNASETLLILGTLLAFLFLGITFLAHRYQVNPLLIEQGKTVTSQIAAKVYGGASFLFYATQTFTALILFLAANTSFADFPRLASILAKDRYLPRALQNRGDRLAFSNGIVILAVAAGGLLIHYGAEVHKIIPLYVIGVFTSFTLSQAGMVKNWFTQARTAERLGRPAPRGWRRAALINAVGAVTTAVVFVVVSATKFKLGAWQVMLFIPVLAWILSRVRIHFDHVAEELRVHEAPPPLAAGKVVLALNREEGATKALALTRTIAARDLRVVALASASDEWVRNLHSSWDGMGIKLEIEPIGRGVRQLESYVRSMEPNHDAPVTMVLPDPQYSTLFEQVRKSFLELRIKRKFLFEVQAILVSVPFRPGREPEPQRLRAPGRFALIVFVSSVNRATLRAMSLAESLHPSSLSAMSIQTLPGEAAQLTDDWVRWGVQAPLEIVDSPYRSLMEPVLREVRELRPNPSDAVGVVVPEFVVKHWWQALLHNQTAFLIKSALLFEPNVVVINVPYRLGNGSSSTVEPKGPVNPVKPVKVPAGV